MKKVYVFCNHPVPFDHPNGIRMANIGNMLSLLGYQVYLLGITAKKKTETCHNAIICKEYALGHSSGIRGAIQSGKKARDILRQFIADNGKPDLIVSVLYNSKPQRFLIRYCKKECVPLIQSVGEWFDRSAFRGLKGIIKFINNRYSLRVQNTNTGNIIAISSLLNDYYCGKGCNTVLIPTIVNMEEYKGLKHRAIDDKVRIAYAGTPGKKDYILNAIRALTLLDAKQREKIELNLYGPEVEQLRALGLSDETLSMCGDSLVCHGRIPYAEVKGRIADADFTVLLRPNKRYANAGFPTKVGESMACGTPVIANLTSDLGKYIIDGQTGFVCADESSESCADAFRKVLQMTDNEIEAMRKTTLEMARNAFDYRVYTDALEAFLQQLQ